MTYKGLTPRQFGMFMHCETVASLRQRQKECIKDGFYEGAAIIRDLLKEREGKLEIWTEDNVPAYFEIRA